MEDGTESIADYFPIGDYAIIGDCHTIALIARDGSIDWFCPERFDGPAVFCRLLDAGKGGSFRLRPAGRFSAEHRYKDATNVLETTFTTAAGRARLTDLMPICQRKQGDRGYDVGTFHRIIRLVEGLDGEVDLEISFKPTFGYALIETGIQRAPGGAVAQADGQFLTLACPGVELKPDGTGALRGRLRIGQGEQCWVVVSSTRDERAAREALAPSGCQEQLEATVDYWETWATFCTYQGPYRAEVLRSALTLKLLTYEPTGALVAAPTTSLPEQIGGSRNWDYRYSWLRDSALTLYAMMTVGYNDEAADFFHWLVRTTANDPSPIPQIMYRVGGGRELREVMLHQLAGYRDSRPVRIGNAASEQHQLDIYGEVLRAAYLHFHHQGDERREGNVSAGRAPGTPPPPEVWAMLRELIRQAAERWQEPDNGIWEVRGGPKHFLHSKLMCWAALDRGIRLAHEHELDAPLDRWRHTRDEIRKAILTRGYNTEIGAFTQSFGSRDLDASALAIPRIGFLPPSDPRVRSTVERIRTQLMNDGLVCRYRTADGLPGGEGSFALCTFWLVEALALEGELDAAHDLFERVLGYTNDVGLLSEEINPITNELLGNFPQGFTHLGLINAAVNLAKAAKHGAEEQPENEAERAERAGRAAAEGYSARSQPRHAD